MKSKKRSVFVVCLLFLFSTSLWNPSTASAEMVMRVYSPSDSYNPPGLSSTYDITSIETAIDSDDPDKIYFWIIFKNAIKASQFVHFGTKEPWAAIFLYREEPDSRGGNFDDIRIETNKTTAFSGNYTVDAEAHGNEYSGDDRYELSDCNAEAWTNLDTAANWVGFSISRSCANIPNEFWVSAYTDPDDNNSTTVKDFDWAPDEAWYVDISEADYIESEDYTELEPQTITFYQSPDIALSKKVAYLRAFSDSGLDLEFTSSTPKVCVPLNWSSAIRLINTGTCKITANQGGDDSYDVADSVTMSFKVTKVAVKSKVVAKPIPVPAPTKKAPGSIGGKTKN